MTFRHTALAAKINDKRLDRLFRRLLAMIADYIQRPRVKWRTIQVLCTIVISLCKSKPFPVFFLLIIYLNRVISILLAFTLMDALLVVSAI